MSDIIKQTMDTETALARGRELVQKIRALLKKAQSPSFSQVLKWDRNQPRGPKGSPTGGRWVKGVSAGAGSAESFSTAPGMERDSGSYLNALIGATTPPSGVGINARGEQFAFGEKVYQNKPRAIGSPRADVGLARAMAEEKALEAADKTGVTHIMTEGEATQVVKKFSGGVNSSYLVKLEHSDGGTVKAVYKPEGGETWRTSFQNTDISRYITNREFSLAEREAMASEVSKGLGFGDLVPETHLRTELTVPGLGSVAEDEDDEDYAGGYDEDYAREQYDEYREKRQEEAMDEVGQEMYDLYLDAQVDHVKDIENRIEELQEIWDEEKENFPEENEYGRASALREHPVLPLDGSKQFERKELLEGVDPLEMLKDADVNMDGKLSDKEKESVRLAVREALEAGHRELAELDQEAARQNLDYDDWIQSHDQTEANLYDRKIQSFTSWRQSQGMDSGGGGGGRSNPNAPHPNGGSLQRYVANLKSDGDLTHEDATELAVLDYALGTMDRHGNNLKFLPDLDDDGNEISRPVAIDNGYSMPGSTGGPDDFTFRSGAVAEWMSDDRHHRVEEARRQPMLDALNKTDWQAMADRHPSMSREERAAFLGRIGRLKDALEYR